ncbi:hypothetical protein LEN26_014624 [Aphanomyces euteiches]|nr:hypothetical protein LEN26_014624 [Aphanomyces euteiches]
MHIWALSILCVIGGHYYGWNTAYATGFIPFFCSQAMMGTMFIAYVACISEVGGKVPGGSYGLARAVLGFYPGFMLGCLELLEYVSFGSVSILYVADFMTEYFEWPQDLEPIVWLILYAVFIAILESKGKYMWRFILVFAIVCLLPGVLYIVSSPPYLNLKQHGDLSSAFFAILPTTTVGYAGIESLTVVTGFAKDPAYSIPKGTVAAVWTLFVSSLWIILTMASLPPGLDVTSADEYFLNRGLNLEFGFSADLSEWLMVIPQLGMAMSFFIPYARYKSPYGLLGAYYVWLVSFLLFLSIAGGFQDDEGIAILSTIGFIAVMSIYYRFGCQATQTVSQEEYASIFKFSVMKFNKLRQKKKKTSPSSGGGGTSLWTKLSFWTGSKRTSITPIAPGGGGVDTSGKSKRSGSKKMTT